MANSTLSSDQRVALNSFAFTHGRRWKAVLRRCWESGRYPCKVAHYPILQSLRNAGSFGPAGLTRYRVNKIITADKWLPGCLAYLWEETGEGSLRRVTAIRADGWIVTGLCSWCCCPDTTLWLCSSEEARETLERLLRADLADRRANWGAK